MLVIVDFSNVAVACFFSSVLASGKKPENVPPYYEEHVGHFEEKMFSVSNKFDMPYQHFVYALDSKPKWKFEIYPEYKANRASTKLGCDPKMAPLRHLKNLGATCMRSEGQEADDVIATLCHKHAAKGPVVVVTSDKDLWQLNAIPQVSVYNHHTKKMVDLDDMEKAFGIRDYRQIKLVKSLWGDSGDNVPNAVPRMQKYLHPVIAKCSNGNLDEFYDLALKTDISDRCRQLLTENRDRVYLNQRLVELNPNCKLEAI